MRLILPILLMLLATGYAMADRTTRRGSLRPDPDKVETAVRQPVADTLEICGDDVSVSGYDKPLRATREAMFLTNLTELLLSGVELEINYSDLQGRELHHRTVWVECDLPPGATRRVDCQSWDRQHTFYYVKGPAPRVDRVTPYEVRVRPLRATAAFRTPE